MSSRPKTRTDTVADCLLAAGAAIAAFRGDDPSAIASRVQRAASGIRAMCERLEDLADQHVRAAVGCRQPANCDCLYCLERERDRASERIPS